MRLKHTKSPDNREDNLLTHLKSLQCSSVIEQQLYDSNQMSWLGQLVNGLEKQSPSRSQLYEDKGLEKAYTMSRKRYQNFNPLYRTDNISNKLQLSSNQRLLRTGGLPDFRKDRIQSNTSVQGKLIYQSQLPERRPLSTQSINRNSYQTAGNQEQLDIAHVNYIQAYNRMPYWEKVSSDSIGHQNPNQSIGKIRRNRDLEQQKQNRYLLKDHKNTHSKQVIQTSSSNCRQRMMDEQAAESRARYQILCKRRFDQEEKRLGEMEEKLDQVIRRSAGKIKSSNQTLQNNSLKSSSTNQPSLTKNNQPIYEAKRGSAISPVQTTYRSVSQFNQYFPRNKSYQSDNTADSQRPTHPITEKENSYKDRHSSRGIERESCSVINNLSSLMSNGSQSWKRLQGNSIGSRDKISRLFPKLEDIIPEQSSEQISSNSSARFGPHFKRIFSMLDQNGLGTLDRNNCQAWKLSDELKYILGSILSKIKYQGRTYDCYGFVTECERIASSLDSSQIKQILDKIPEATYQLETRKPFYEENIQIQPKQPQRDYMTIKNSTTIKENQHQKIHQKRIQRVVRNQSPESKIKRQPYLEQPSIILSASIKASPIRHRQILDSPQKQICNHSEENYPLSKNPYFQQQQGQQISFDQHNRVGKEIDSIREDFTSPQPDLIDSTSKTNIDLGCVTKRQERARIESLNRRLQDYIKNIGIECSKPGGIDLNFKELNKNLNS